MLTCEHKSLGLKEVSSFFAARKYLIRIILS